jgi:hypothetical protein
MGVLRIHCKENNVIKEGFLKTVSCPLAFGSLEIRRDIRGNKKPSREFEKTQIPGNLRRPSGGSREAG